MRYECAYSDKSKAQEAICALASRYCRDGKALTLLVPTYSESVRMQKALAAHQCGFGVNVTTVALWVEEMWDLWGDARQLVGQADRFLFMRKALRWCQESEDFSLEVTPGMVSFLVRIAREALPLATSADLTTGAGSRDSQIYACLNVYESLLSNLGVIDESTALTVLAEKGILSQASVVVYDCITTVLQDRLIETAAEVHRVAINVEEMRPQGSSAAELEALRSSLYRPNFENPVQSQGAVRFVFPEGAYAQPRLLIRSILSLVERLTAQGVACPALALSAKKPAEMFEALAHQLANRGIQVRMEDGVLFKQTAFGKSWLALMEYLNAGNWETPGAGHLRSSLATDFCLSPFSFMSVKQAQSLDGRLRGWRGQTIEEALTDMSAFSHDEHRDFLSTLESGDILRALQLQEQWVSSQMSWPEAFRIQQLSAVKKALAIHEKGETLGLPLQDILECLSDVAVGVTQEWKVDASTATLLVGSLPRVSRADAQEYDAVILCDMTADAYPLKDDLRAADLFLEKLAAYKPRNKGAELHRCFYEALAATRFEVLLVRSLHGADTEELRPASFWEELVDCYRKNPQDPEEIHKVLGLPPCLMAYAYSLGEEKVMLSLDAAEVSEGAHNLAIPVESEPQRVSSVRVLASAPSFADEPCMHTPDITLSPSAIESYLECPFKWFADRRLGLSSPDADFDLRAFGSFAHNVLEVVHNRLTRDGLRRVTRESLPDALDLLECTFAQLFEEEQLRIADDALIPLTQSDRLEVERLRRTLQDYLRWEVNLLPEYAPYQAELAFGEDNPVEYAGVSLRGRLDRVDVDAFGNAVIIDYKTSVSAAHAFRLKDAEEWALPRKVQAAIYAQVVRRKFGLMPAAALYVSYKKPCVMGLYNETLLTPQHMPGIKADLCGTRNMLDDLDRCEEMIAHRLEDMRAGLVPMNPVDGKACRYCSVTSCSGRC